uniref:Uncharacterized protein n=1 Tax=Anguilla anguilla TaxID=7936 RepID=A0A0E9SXA0_ANGAN
MGPKGRHPQPLQLLVTDRAHEQACSLLVLRTNCSLQTSAK